MTEHLLGAFLKLRVSVVIVFSALVLTISGCSSQQIVGPSVTLECKPVYPQVSKRLGEFGVVRVKVFVEATDLATHSQVSKSSGFERLDMSALDAVRCMRFSAARVSGVPSAMWLEIPIRFVLD
jgi:TonB family protein